MLRFAALGLLLASAVTLSSSAVVLENGLPNLWSQTASQVTELPTQDGILTPNPWNYLNRQSLYRLMIAGTDPYLTYMGTTQTENPFWGLALQLGWMQTSGKTAFCFFLNCVFIIYQMSPNTGKCHNVNLLLL